MLVPPSSHVDITDKHEVACWLYSKEDVSKISMEDAQADAAKIKAEAINKQ